MILDLQDGLQFLEERLEAHIRWENGENGNKDRLASRRLDNEEKMSRENLIKQIKEKLEEYGVVHFRFLLPSYVVLT